MDSKARIQCSKKIWKGSGPGMRLCARKATIKWMDWWFCWQHDPTRTGKARRLRITDFGVITYENLLIYTEALEKTVKKTVKSLYGILNGMYNGAAYDAGFPGELCETMRKMAEGDPEDLSHVKEYVRRMTE